MQYPLSINDRRDFNSLRATELVAPTVFSDDFTTVSNEFSRFIQAQFKLNSSSIHSRLTFFVCVVIRKRDKN